MMPQAKEDRPVNAAEIDRIRIEYDRRNQEIAADRYSWVHAVNRYTHTQIWRAAIQCMDREGFFPLRSFSPLDVGCGRGSWLMEFVQWGADPARVAGIDLMAERVVDARKSLPDADIQLGDASRMPWADSTFDVVSQFAVFTSVLDPSMRRKMAAEMLRVLKPQGMILWYDFAFDNPQNANVRGIKQQEVRDLFAGCDVTIRKIMLAPPIARAVVPVSWILAHMLEKLPFLRTHLIGTIRKRSR